jgi:hypothetical protein
MSKLSQGQKRKARRQALEKARAMTIKAELGLSRAAAREVGAKVMPIVDDKGILLGTIVSPSYRDGTVQFEDCARI